MDSINEVNESPTKRKRTKRQRKARATFEAEIRESNLRNVGEGEISEEELELAQLLFGGTGEILDDLNSSISIEEKKREKFVSEKKTSDEKDEENVEAVPEKKIKVAAWQDDDDERILVKDKSQTWIKCHRSVTSKNEQKYNALVREKFTNITGTPKWADLDREDCPSDSDDDESNKLLRKTGDFVLKSLSLPRRVLDIRKCPNLLQNSQAIVKSIEFHPMSKVAVVSALDGTAVLYQVDGKNNPMIQSVLFEQFPVHVAHFTTDGNELIVASTRCGHYYSYDMIQGKISKVPWEKGMEQTSIKRFNICPNGKIMVIHGRFGNIHFVDVRTKEWIASVKINGEVSAITFNRDGSRMYTQNDLGQIYVWDTNSRTCLNKFNDQGCIAGSGLALSPNDQYLAAGSQSGVVNVYMQSDLTNCVDPKPAKALMNLTTEANCLKFNCTSEILAISSSYKINALKLVHFPSMSVFSNFPTQDSRFHNINCLDISLNSGFMMFANGGGKVHLYRLRHYKNY